MELSPAATLEIADFLSAIGGSLVASAIALALYMATYGRSSIGAGVHRMFLLGGPSITALLLAIQFSLPLSLGLLGALSIVRFRAPVKDPAEIGYLLLLIAGAIGCATFNYWLVVILYAFAVLLLVCQHFLQRLPESARGLLIISADDPGVSENEAAISALVKRQLRDARLETVSTFGGRAQFHYQFNKPKDMDWGHFKQELDGIVSPATTELHVG
jgi:hypothetical protein